MSSAIFPDLLLLWLMSEYFAHIDVSSPLLSIYILFLVIGLLFSWQPLDWLRLVSYRLFIDESHESSVSAHHLLHYVQENLAGFYQQKKAFSNNHNRALALFIILYLEPSHSGTLYVAFFQKASVLLAWTPSRKYVDPFSSYNYMSWAAKSLAALYQNQDSLVP